MSVLKFKNAQGQWEAVETPGALKYTEQTLTENQINQARVNLQIENNNAVITGTSLNELMPTGNSIYTVQDLKCKTGDLYIDTAKKAVYKCTSFEKIVDSSGTYYNYTFEFVTKIGEEHPIITINNFDPSTYDWYENVIVPEANFDVQLNFLPGSYGIFPVDYSGSEYSSERDRNVSSMIANISGCYEGTGYGFAFVTTNMFGHIYRCVIESNTDGLINPGSQLTFQSVTGMIENEVDSLYNNIDGVDQRLSLQLEVIDSTTIKEYNNVVPSEFDWWGAIKTAIFEYPSTTLNLSSNEQTGEFQINLSSTAGGGFCLITGTDASAGSGDSAPIRSALIKFTLYYNGDGAYLTLGLNKDGVDYISKQYYAGSPSTPFSIPNTIPVYKVNDGIVKHINIPDNLDVSSIKYYTDQTVDSAGDFIKSVASWTATYMGMELHGSAVTADGQVYYIIFQPLYTPPEALPHKGVKLQVNFDNSTKTVSFGVVDVPEFKSVIEHIVDLKKHGYVYYLPARTNYETNGYVDVTTSFYPFNDFIDRMNDDYSRVMLYCAAPSNTIAAYEQAPLIAECVRYVHSGSSSFDGATFVGTVGNKQYTIELNISTYSETIEASITSVKTIAFTDDIPVPMSKTTIDALFS